MTKDRKHKINIDDLPNELLTRIFSCLPLKHDLDDIQLVSKRWYAVVDETIGREIAITCMTSDNETVTAVGDFPCVPYAHLGCLGFDMISKLGVRTCHVHVDLTSCDNTAGRIENQDNDSNDEGTATKKDDLSVVPIPHSFKYPHLLKQLYINGCIRSDLFHCLLTGTENLAFLQFNLLALSQLAPFDVKHLKLPHLKSLGVSKCLKASYRDFDDTLGLPNLQILLKKNRFPSLAQLDLRFPIKNFRDFGTIEAIFQLLAVHLFVKELYVVMEFPVQVNVLSGIQEELSNLINFAKKHKNISSLKICEVQGIRIHASYPQLKLWQAFLGKQQCLRTLTLRLGNLSDLFLYDICTNSKGSLENLFLYKLNEVMDDDQHYNDIALDCRVFAPALKLQTLYALGCDLIRNVRSLPLSLSTLFLAGIITASEVEYILLELPELKFVSLKNSSLGKDSSYGVSLDLLKRFIEARKIKRMILNGSSLNENYPPDGMCNGDPNTPARLMEFDNNWDLEHVYLDWELNKDLYYVDKCY